MVADHIRIKLDGRRFHFPFPLVVAITLAVLVHVEPRDHAQLYLVVRFKDAEHTGNIALVRRVSQPHPVALFEGLFFDHTKATDLVLLVNLFLLPLAVPVQWGGGGGIRSRG